MIIERVPAALLLILLATPAVADDSQFPTCKPIACGTCDGRHLISLVCSNGYRGVLFENGRDTFMGPMLKTGQAGTQTDIRQTKVHAIYTGKFPPPRILHCQLIDIAGVSIVKTAIACLRD